jgi:hypothetical protein
LQRFLPFIADWWADRPERGRIALLPSPQVYHYGKKTMELGASWGTMDELIGWLLPIRELIDPLQKSCGHQFPAS